MEVLSLRVLRSALIPVENVRVSAFPDVPAKPTVPVPVHSWSHPGLRSR